jgi:hypothetical protein
MRFGEDRELCGLGGGSGKCGLGEFGLGKFELGKFELVEVEDFFEGEH